MPVLSSLSGQAQDIPIPGDIKPATPSLYVIAIPGGVLLFTRSIPPVPFSRTFSMRDAENTARLLADVMMTIPEFVSDLGVDPGDSSSSKASSKATGKGGAL